MKFSRLVTVPLTLLVILFAIANRHQTLLSFDPFSQESPLLALNLPLWLIVFSAFFGGFVIGGITSWTSRISRSLARGFAHRVEKRAARLAVRLREADPLADLPRIKTRTLPLARSTSWLGALRARLTGKRAAQ